MQTHPTGVLAKYSRDLTSLAREGKLDPVVGRHSEMRRLIDVLGRRTKNRWVKSGCEGLRLWGGWGRCSASEAPSKEPLQGVMCACQQPPNSALADPLFPATPVPFSSHLLTCLACSAVLIGEPGVGKTSIIHGLSQRLVAGDVPESIRGARLIALELGLLMAGVSVFASWFWVATPMQGMRQR